MRTLILTASLCTTLAAFTGCVPQDRYDNLNKAHLTLKEENIVLQDKIESQEAANRLLQQRIADAGGEVGSLRNENESLRGDVNRFADDMARMEQDLNSMEFILPAEVNVQLQRLADNHPGLLTFDQQRGMVRFASDLTFDLGSADLKSQAKDSIRTLAGILNDAAVSDYEVKVVGHTDSVPIVNAGTKRNHPTNMHLSVHRSISVASAMQNAGVDPRRVQVAGYGQHRPIVQDGAGGAAENRRVEIYLVPLTTDLAEVPQARSTSGSSAPAQPSTTTQELEPMK